MSDNQIVFRGGQIVFNGTTICFECICATECGTDCDSCPGTYLLTLTSGLCSGQTATLTRSSCDWTGTTTGGCDVILRCYNGSGGWRLEVYSGDTPQFHDFNTFSTCPPTGSFTYGTLE